MDEPRNPDTTVGPGFGERPLPDHAEASAQLLEHYAARIRRGEYAPDFGAELILVARVIARRI